MISMQIPSDIVDDCSLYLGDSFDILDAFENESFDALVTDPPYGIGHQYNQREKSNNAEDYWTWLKPIYEKMLAKIKPGGFVAVWQTQKYFKHFWEWYGEQIHIYSSCKNFVQLRDTEINYGYDPIVMFYKDAEEISKEELLKPEKPKRSIDFFIAKKLVDLDEKDWFLANTTLFKRGVDMVMNHPCPRPIDQVETIVANYTLHGGNVLDAFMGTGTVGVACVKHGRKFTGVEIDPEYYDIAKNRIHFFSQKVKTTRTLTQFVH